MIIFSLRFDKNLIPRWATCYNAEEDTDVERIASQASTRGYFTKANLVDFCEWKSKGRTRRQVELNHESFIQAITQTALSIPNEQLRIEVLTLLRGVGWSTASAILHLCHTDPYPILDFRALWSLSVDVPDQYDFEFWWAYTRFCRTLASRAGVSMRVLDRALWKYSKEKQS